MKICPTLLKIYRETFLKSPIKPEIHLKRHTPTINFKKLQERNLIPEPMHAKSTYLRNEDRGFDFIGNKEKSFRTIDNCPNPQTISEIRKRIKGLIELDKQMPRKNKQFDAGVPDYAVNYKLVLPRIQTKVDYKRELNKKNGRGRTPLIEPWPSKTNRRNKSLLI